MKKFTKFIVKIWNDPVWSKVIASIIFLFLCSIFIILNLIFKFYLKICNFFILNKILSISITLNIIFIILLIITLFMLSKFNIKGLKWLKSLKNIEFEKYNFLLWFPANNILRSNKYGGQNFMNFNFDAIPEIRELIERKILYYVIFQDNSIEIELNKNIYNYLLNEFFNKNNDNKDKLIYKYLGVPFHKFLINYTDLNK